MLCLLLAPVLAQAGLSEPSLRSPNLAAVAMETHEILGAMSESDLEVKESSILALLVKVSSHADEVLSNADHLGTVSEGLIGLLERNMSAKVAAKFVETMRNTLSAFKGTVAKAKGSNLEEIIKNIKKCEGKLTIVEKTEAAVLDKSEDHGDCIVDEVKTKEEYDACLKQAEELNKFEGEDGSCKEWPAMQSLRPEEVIPDCEQSLEGETYEEYLERSRSLVDSKLRLYREMKNACGTRNVVDTCSVEHTKYQATKERCSAHREELAHKACVHANVGRIASNNYVTCWNHNTELYKSEAMQSDKFSKAQEMSFMASEQIDCLLAGFTAADPKAVIKDCKEKSSKVAMSQTLQLNVICPPPLLELPFAPNPPGCHLAPLVPVSKVAEQPMDCAEVVEQK